MGATVTLMHSTISGCQLDKISYSNGVLLKSLQQLATLKFMASNETLHSMT